jgi:uncharacterized protein (TIGR04255 family)
MSAITNEESGDDVLAGVPANHSEPLRPHFERPPLNEVVCGVQFEPIAGWQTSHYGLFWSRIRADYPRCEDQPPLPRLRLDGDGEPEFQVGPLPPLRRVFLVHESQNYVIQIQPCRFLHNWRKIKDSDAYPRFEEAFLRFTEYWGRLCEFLLELKLPAPKPEAYELTYLNYISAEDMFFPRDVWRFLNFYKSVPLSASSAQPTGMSLTFVWPLPGVQGELHMVSRHGRRIPDGKDILLVEFTARGRAGATEADMKSWFATAHESIVHTFVALTTEEAHALWGRVA